ncbi:MAG: N-acetylglucosamine-6-phosphate deacetylase [Clostridia bacterium]|nr:N-acetylglucosamine-6-phosphate deacetylase [Clostridia bacterium]
MNSIYAKQVWTSSGWLHNARVYIEDGIIDHISANEDTNTYDVSVLIPGMIELHAHGSLGYNAALPNKEENEQWLKRLALHGVTGILPTLSSSPPEKVRDAVAFYDEIVKNPVDNGARVLGVHLEGPFLNFEKRGGINGQYITLPSLEHFEKLTGDRASAVKQITLAPELEGALELIRYLKENNVHVNAGHSNATAEEMRTAIKAGLDGVTHFFNATRPINHRDPGLLTEAIINDGVFSEIVCDLVHLAPEIIRLLVKAVGPRRLSVITDAVTLTGMPDGRYDDRIVKDGSPRLENGTLTGGRYLMDDCARALISIGIDPWDVFCMTSNTPARRISEKTLGDIAPSFKADLVGMDTDYRIRFTMIDGSIINI